MYNILLTIRMKFLISYKKKGYETFWVSFVDIDGVLYYQIEFETKARKQYALDSVGYAILCHKESGKHYTINKLERDKFIPKFKEIPDKVQEILTQYNV